MQFEKEMLGKSPVSLKKPEQGSAMREIYQTIDAFTIFSNPNTWLTSSFPLQSFQA